MAHRPHLVCSLALAASAACAHVSPADPAGPADKEHEVAVLRERVGRLERRLSDLDAQMKLMSERVADGGGPYQVSLGPPSHRPGSYEERTAGPAYQRLRAAAEAPPPEPAAASWHDTPGLRSIDLGTLPARPRYDDSEDLDLVDDGEPLAAPPAPANAPATSAPAAARAPSGDVQSRYDWARGQMEEGRYPEAVAAFEGILKQDARHRLADNSLYWIGACHLQRGAPRMAIDTWKTLPLRFPDSAKMADSLFGMATAHEELGEPVLAETLYMQLVEQYPRAERAGEARRALKRLSGSPDAPR